MNIVHICLAGPVTDGWSYQENLLTKYHKKMGHNVTIIASRYVWDVNGNLTLAEENDYINSDGVHVIRINNKYKTTINSKIKVYESLFDKLISIKPNIIFVHGVQFPGISEICKYIRENKTVEVYVDNHADFSNSAKSFVSRYILHRIIWKYYAKKIEPYVKKFYGVMPSRVEFLNTEYGIPKEKIELLLMGADDEVVESSLTCNVRAKIREKYNISEKDFLVITGGKIDLAKAQVLLLMEAICRLKVPNVKLIVFGSVVEELKGKIESLADGEKVQYIGWVNSNESCDYFAAADLVVFPGRHSVFWEQVAALGIPMIVKYWEGTTHVNMKGNLEFLYEDSVEEIQKQLIKVIDNYDEMKKVALSNKKKFLYSEIAIQSIQ